ncbi:MAG: class I adenylate-forming enzyme family protein [Sulfolobaceae archaeon]|nr:class I adenylate-forming enzyme family protein [Sulfolobaceae archaeon]
MSLAELVNKWYRRTPSKTFLIGERTITYESARDEISKLANNFYPGETVVHFMFNSVKSILYYLAMYWAGAKIIALDPLTSAEDLKFILEDANPDLIVTDNEILEREKNVLKDYKVATELNTKEMVVSPYIYREDEVGLVYYYAGIAGRTMQVLHSAKRVELNSAMLFREYGMKELKGILIVPLAHVLGNSVLGVVLEAGGTLYIERKFDPVETINAIDKYGLNFIATVPMVYDAINEVGRGSLSSLELCISAGAPLFPSTVDKFREKYNKTIVQEYGFTEGLVLTFQPIKYANKLSIGKPLQGVEIKIVKDDGKEAGLNETGELWVKAPWLMLGYSDVQETAKVFKDGWLKTGDLVSVDENGLLYFKGVKKRMLKFKGYPIFPRDLEEILKKHPNVIDAKVIGEDAGNLGQQPVAKVVVKEKRENLAEELLNFVNSRVAFYKKLKRVDIVDKIE